MLLCSYPSAGSALCRLPQLLLQALIEQGTFVQACLSWWSIVSPFGGFGSTAALVFVCLVAAVKALWEDSKRHIEDRKTNASTAHLVDPSGRNPKLSMQYLPFLIWHKS